MKLKPQLITFDFGDTLVSSEPPYLTRIWMGLKGLGIKCQKKQVEQAYHLADMKISKELLRREEYAPLTYQQALGYTLLDQLGIKKYQDKILEKLTRFLVDFRPERVMVPGAREVLKELHQRGYLMGIISNNDGKTKEKCRRVGIEHYFAFILDSTLEKMCKPAPAFFKKALKLAGVKPEEALHIGDLWGSDILGANQSGWWAIWIENKYVKPQKLKRVFRVKKIQEVLKYLE